MLQGQASRVEGLAGKNPAGSGEPLGPFAEEIGAFSFAFAEARARLEEAAREKGVLSP